MEEEARERLRLGLEDLMDDRDYLYRLISNIDWDSQLDTVRSVLRQHRQAADRDSANIKDLEEVPRTYDGPYHNQVVDQHVEGMWQSSYSHASISLSAIGMVVPMAETIYAQAFQALGEKYVAKGMTPPQHRRWTRAEHHPDLWNVQRYFATDGVETDIISGLKQLCEASGVSTFFRPDDKDRVSALFHYRNQMFHGGFEWSIAQRQSFVKLIAERGWERYFLWSTTHGDPWICYLRDDIIDALSERLFEALGSLGRFVKALPYELMTDSSDEALPPRRSECSHRCACVVSPIPQFRPPQIEIAHRPSEDFDDAVY